MFLSAKVGIPSERTKFLGYFLSRGFRLCTSRISYVIFFACQK